MEVILQRLHEQYPETPVPLDHSDPFTLLIAVLLSAQCTDKKVNEVTPALFAAGPTPAAMAALEEEQIQGDRCFRVLLVEALQDHLHPLRPAHGFSVGGVILAPQ